jgi:hypothetical protein
LTVLDFAVGANYIVTDLELRARFELSSLDGELRRAGLHGWVTLHGAVWRANYSGSDRCCRNPSEELDHLLQIVEGLGEASRDLWDRCISRRFDLGYACFDERFASRSQIKAPLLRRLADVNGDLVVTIYRADEKEQTT